MTNDSTTSIISAEKSQMKTPRRSSVNFIREFSRTYAVMAGIALNGMICN